MKDYESLPMNLGEAAIREATDELLVEARAEPRPDPRLVAEALVDMIARQSSLYKPMANDLRERVAAWVDEAWATEPLALFDALSAVAVNMGTPRMRERLEEAARDPDPEVRALAEEALAEM